MTETIHTTTFEHRFQAGDTVWAIGIDRNKKLVPMKCFIDRLFYSEGKDGEEKAMEYDIIIHDRNEAVIYSWIDIAVRCKMCSKVPEKYFYKTEQECIERVGELSEAFQKRGFPAWVDGFFKKNQKEL